MILLRDSGPSARGSALVNAAFAGGKEIKEFLNFRNHRQFFLDLGDRVAGIESAGKEYFVKVAQCFNGLG